MSVTQVVAVWWCVIVRHKLSPVLAHNWDEVPALSLLGQMPRCHGFRGTKGARAHGAEGHFPEVQKRV
eukprot:CAMPEP_0174370990 /NCGR_PEP_ID=MMETSP0811_2-20130205/98149_1 /TAXON_ID=73025 ORGANISM="Eutreptiella gymnastica-like, Strain CCMP1594" /NCGR_SAMPLE_ID=MMETSP0811_2 /ASSEMBLY_ACC=CAM_ASM_000667 /LENGTH=67 /DNA_ID=CAMNT_0015516957 /DNA_START=101 /DNA_END=304 /DNA_ORIENTATION=-